MIERFLYRPLALLPEHGAALLEQLRLATGGAPRAALTLEGSPGDRRPYDVVSGIAVVPVCGVLVHDATWWWDETCYLTLRATLAQAVLDPEVKGICLHVNSPGGEVAGCFDLADDIFALRGVKPVWAIVDEYAFSAAYALASAAERIIVPRTGGTGSIGVITLRPDITGALDQMGIKIETIQFGDRKTDNYPTTPLSEAARARIQADIDALGQMFVDLVARHRGIDAAEVRATEAGTFLGQAGVNAGLADAVMAPDEAFLSFVAYLEGQSA